MFAAVPECWGASSVENNYRSLIELVQVAKLL